MAFGTGSGDRSIGRRTGGTRTNGALLTDTSSGIFARTTSAAPFRPRDSPSHKEKVVSKRHIHGPVGHPGGIRGEFRQTASSIAEAAAIGASAGQATGNRLAPVILGCGGAIYKGTQELQRLFQAAGNTYLAGHCPACDRAKGR